MDQRLIPQKQTLRDKSRTDLVIDREQVLVRRNLAILFGLVVGLLILVLRWSAWAQLFPVLIWIFAASQHLRVRLIEDEIRRREKQSAGPKPRDKP